MDENIRRFEIAGRAEPWTDSVLIQQKLVVIPAQAATDSPRPEPDQVLHKCRLLEIQTPARKLEVRRHAGIELRGVGNDVAETFAQVAEVAFESALKLVPPAMI